MDSKDIRKARVAIVRHLWELEKLAESAEEKRNLRRASEWALVVNMDQDFLDQTEREQVDSIIEGYGYEEPAYGNLHYHFQDFYGCN